MPDGSSSAAPVTSPGPSSPKNCRTRRGAIFLSFPLASSTSSFVLARGKTTRFDCADDWCHQSDATIDEFTGAALGGVRSEEHTSELQSQFHLVCRLLL